MSYGLHFLWNEKNPFFIKDYIYITLKSSLYPTIFGGIHKEYRSGIINRRYWYVLEMNFRDAETGRKLGGYYNSLEDAKAAANRFIKMIFYDPRDYGPQQPEKQND
jgi:hypothetical protein